jgi:DNA-binding transcriptional LysR family regulator
MDLQQLRALVLVAEAGSVTEAARRLYLTQPAVTRQIRALEDELGGSLFDRTKKPLAPTSLGETALEQARRILRMAEDLRATVSSDAGTLKGELRVGVSHTLAREVLTPLALELRRQYPGLRLRLTTEWGAALRRLVEEELLDAAIGLAPPQMHFPAGLAARQLGPGPELAVPVSSVKTPLKGTVPVGALRGVGWVLSPEGCGYRAQLKRNLEEAGISFHVVVEAPNIDLQLELIREGLGAGIVPKRGLPSRLAEAGLQTFQIEGLTFSLAVWLSYRPVGPIIPVAIPVIERTISALLQKTTKGANEQRGIGRRGPARGTGRRAR